MNNDQVGFLPGMQGYLPGNTKNATGPMFYSAVNSMTS